MFFFQVFRLYYADDFCSSKDHSCMVAFALMLTALLVSNSGIFGYFIQNTAFNKAAANACFTIPDNTFSTI